MNMTKMTVNLTPQAVAALEMASTRCEDTHTDTVNRALIVYDEITAAVEWKEPVLRFNDGSDGRTVYEVVVKVREQGAHP